MFRYKRVMQHKEIEIVLIGIKRQKNKDLKRRVIISCLQRC